MNEILTNQDEILQITDRMLTILDTIRDFQDELTRLTDGLLILAIPEDLAETDDLGNLPDGVWTLDRFMNTVSPENRETYQRKNEDGALYEFWTDLCSLIQEREWELTYRLGKKYVVFRVADKRVFGINLFSTPRLAVWITEQDARSQRGRYEYDNYYNYHKHAVYPKDTTVEELSDLLEFAYSQCNHTQ